MTVDFNQFVNEYTILDSEVSSIEIRLKNAILYVVMSIRLKDDVIVQFTFKGVTEYNFYFSSSNTFYIVTDYVLAKDNGAYYISLDPYDGSLGPNDEDMDYISSEELTINITK